MRLLLVIRDLRNHCGHLQPRGLLQGRQMLEVQPAIARGTAELRRRYRLRHLRRRKYLERHVISGQTRPVHLAVQPLRPKQRQERIGLLRLPEPVQRVGLDGQQGPRQRRSQVTHDYGRHPETHDGPRPIGDRHACLRPLPVHAGHLLTQGRRTGQWRTRSVVPGLGIRRVRNRVLDLQELLGVQLARVRLLPNELGVQHRTLHVWPGNGQRLGLRSDQ